ncbi:MAG: hypothetical protein OEP95_12840 [Myxococcales bacterium]|nr:hypothetical protein [Myxococcales bacterium]
MRSITRPCFMLILFTSLLGAFACKPGRPAVEIQSPFHGQFGVPAGAFVRGEVSNVALGTVDVLVNGLPALLDTTTGEFRIAWAVATAAIPADLVFHGVLAEVHDQATGKILARDRVVVHNPQEYGAVAKPRQEGVAQAMAGRIDLDGFDDLELVVGTILTEELRLAEETDPLFVPGVDDVEVDVPPGLVCIDLTPLDASFVDGLLDLFVIDIDPLVATPGDLCIHRAVVDLLVAAPGNVTATLVPGTGATRADVTLEEVEASGSLAVTGELALFDVGGVNVLPPIPFDIPLPECTVTARATDVGGTFVVALEPDENDLTRVDAEIIDDVDLEFELEGVTFEPPCALPFFDPLAGLILGALTPVIEVGVETLANHVPLDQCLADGIAEEDCNSAAARTLELAFEKHQIQPEILVDPVTGGAITVLPGISSVTEEMTGVTTVVSAAAAAAWFHAHAVDQPFYFFVDPGFDPLYPLDTPAGLGFDVASTISTGFANQVLNAATDLGTFTLVEPEAAIDFTELGLCLPDPTAGGACIGGPQDLIDMLVALGVPAAALPSGALELRMRPTLPPVVAIAADAIDPHPAHVHVGQYVVEIVELTAAGDEVWFQTVIDAKLPLQLKLGNGPGLLEFEIEPAEVLGAAVVEQHLMRSWPPDAAAAAVAEAVIVSQLLPQVDAVMDGMTAPSFDDPELEPDTAFDVEHLEMGVFLQYLTAFGNLHPF